MSVRFQDLFHATLTSGGFAYPLPAMWLALSVAAVPEPATKSIWCALTLGSVLLGMLLLHLPRPPFLFVPLALCTLLILVPTFALELGWVQAWLASAMRYRGVLNTM